MVVKQLLLLHWTASLALNRALRLGPDPESPTKLRALLGRGFINPQRPGGPP